MKYLTREQVFEHMRKLGHAVFENDSREYNLNIIGIRSKTAKLDEFGCQLMLAWKFQGKWFDRSYKITTYPGSRYMKEVLLNAGGCAILVPGQYRSIYGIRLHRGLYPAMCQTWGDVSVFRDKDKDNEFDMDPKTIITGEYGINIHRSSATVTQTVVGSYSAGCQVFSDHNQFDDFMSICYKSKANFGNKFTYTLINEP